MNHSIYYKLFFSQKKKQEKQFNHYFLINKKHKANVKMTFITYYFIIKNDKFNFCGHILFTLDSITIFI